MKNINKKIGSITLFSILQVAMIWLTFYIAYLIDVPMDVSIVRHWYDAPYIITAIMVNLILCLIIMLTIMKD